MSNRPENVKAILFDFSRVLLFAKDTKYMGDLNPLHRTLISQNPDYPFLDYFFLNKELLTTLKSIHDKRLFVFTSGAIQDTPAIQNDLNQVFERIYSAEKIGVSKTDPEAYLRLCQEIGLKPSEVLLVDDKSRNIEAAARAGLRTYLFTGNNAIKDLNL